MKRIALGLGAVALVASGLTFAPARATTETDTVEVRLLQLINQGRAGRGKGAEVMHDGLRAKAQQHSQYQSQINALTHDGFSSRINGASPDPYESDGPPDNGFNGAACENVAYYYPGSAGATLEQVAQKFYDLWYNSQGHQNCMFDIWGYGLNAAGTGIYKDSRGYWWATLESARDTTPPTGSSSPPPPTSPTWKRYDQSSSSVLYSGSWGTYSSSGAYGGTYRRSESTGSYARFTFTGIGVRWYGAKSPYGGNAEVRLDGTLVATINQYASTGVFQKMYERTGLTSATHTLEVRVKGTRDSRSAGYRTWADAFDKLS